MPIYVVAVLAIFMLFFNSTVSTRSNLLANTDGKLKYLKWDYDQQEAATTPSSHNFRLPKNLKPQPSNNIIKNARKSEVLYDLVIKVYLPNYVEFPANKNLTTEGEVTIKMVVMQTTNVIVLSMKKIIIFFDECEAHSKLEIEASNGFGERYLLYLHLKGSVSARFGCRDVNRIRFFLAR
ncbi:hypothetical protein Y032_0009g773 [Ancylostoma ceylanicum]|nr:hypothetical protein Y032_0009g773 [Ancylostoma ceylanicum]